MRSESHAGKLAIKGIQALCFQGFRVHSIWERILLKSQELAVEADNIGIGSTSNGEFHRIGEFVPIFSLLETVVNSPLSSAAEQGIGAIWVRKGIPMSARLASLSRTNFSVRTYFC